MTGDRGCTNALSMEKMLWQDGLWQRNTLEFLTPCDALSFASVSRRARETSVRLVRCSLLLGGGEFHGADCCSIRANDRESSTARRWQEVILNSPTSRIHTVIIRGWWMDQGWGEQRGMLSVVVRGGSAPPDDGQWNKDVVTGKEPAPHGLEPIALSFRPRDGVRYELWQRAGGGGCHVLHVHGLEMRQLVFNI
uniref:F-box domain-containing protein n=1 Tax=Odontella aurita TaxID=265563 RepID=A0A7S4MHY6_9STRA|mmetsp:Transcript_22425/g.66483  ORF Transcript_22425/g.66483 Transcript_22425/m.66483 type:complete len:194 (+) Transcript_22425:154-735(+)